MVITDISIPLKYVFTQATEPDDKTEGKLWYNTSDNNLYTSNGTNYVKLGIDTTFFNEIFNNSLDILDIQAQETLDGGQSAYMVRDLFTDADGYLDTVDTGNTTAIFQTNYYKNEDIETSVTDTSGITSPNNSSTSSYQGITIYTKFDLMLTSVNVLSGLDVTRLILTDEEDNILFTSTSKTGDTFNFNPYKLNKETVYKIKCDKNGASYSAKREFLALPIERTNINIGTETIDAWIYNILNVTTAKIIPAEDKIIQSNKQDLNIEPSNFQVYAHKQTLSGTGNITASVSFDNGANYQTVNLNTITTITNKGDEMILKLNLNAGASNGLASCGGYGVMFW